MKVIPAIGMALLCACTGEGPRATVQSVAPGSAASMAEGEADPWTARDAGGATVRITPDGAPRVGMNRFSISVEPTHRVPLSVDLVAPRMPMHGVERHEVRKAGDELSATIDVPMAGDWILYVNFDAGADAVAIPFSVAADGRAEPHHH